MMSWEDTFYRHRLFAPHEDNAEVFRRSSQITFERRPHAERDNVTLEVETLDYDRL